MSFFLVGSAPLTGLLDVAPVAGASRGGEGELPFEASSDVGGMVGTDTLLALPGPDMGGLPAGVVGIEEGEEAATAYTSERAM
jgi:hypothetical protein